VVKRGIVRKGPLGPLLARMRIANGIIGEDPESTAIIGEAGERRY
jgi:hypothetical protein